eukprot:2424609-Rhodomonas_salina.2
MIDAEQVSCRSLVPALIVCLQCCLMERIVSCDARFVSMRLVFAATRCAASDALRYEFGPRVHSPQESTCGQLNCVESEDGLIFSRRCA